VTVPSNVAEVMMSLVIGEHCIFTWAMLLWHLLKSSKKLFFFWVGV